MMPIAMAMLSPPYHGAGGAFGQTARLRWCICDLPEGRLATLRHVWCTALARRCDLLSDDPGDPPSCQPGGMPAIASCDNDHNIVGTAHHGHQSLGIVLVNPGRPVAIAVMRDAFEPAHGHPRLLKDIRPHVRFREAGSGHLDGVLRTDHQGELRSRADLIVIGEPDRFDGLDEGLQDLSSSG